MAGAPTTYNKEIADKICHEIATSTKGINAISKLEGMPAASTIFLWLTKHSEFSEQYARAKETQCELMAEEILTISDDGTNDTMTIEGKGGKLIDIEDKEWTNRSKLRVDSRKWLLSKLMPKKYGEKVDVTSAGEKITGITVDIVHTNKGE